MEHNISGIRFVFTGESFEIEGRGIVYAAKLLEGCTSDQLTALVGKEIDDKIILGVEKFASMHQAKGFPIGLLMKVTNEIRSGAV